MSYNYLDNSLDASLDKPVPSKTIGKKRKVENIYDRYFDAYLQYLIDYLRYFKYGFDKHSIIAPPEFNIPYPLSRADVEFFKLFD
jgi:hypothetical protein